MYWNKLTGLNNIIITCTCTCILYVVFTSMLLLLFVTLCVVVIIVVVYLTSLMYGLRSSLHFELAKIFYKQDKKKSAEDHINKVHTRNN